MCIQIGGEYIMPTLQELFSKYNIDTSASAPNSPRGKLMTQADRMLALLKTYKTEAELDGKTSQYW